MASGACSRPWLLRLTQGHIPPKPRNGPTIGLLFSQRTATSTRDLCFRCSKRFSTTTSQQTSLDPGRQPEEPERWPLPATPATSAGHRPHPQIADGQPEEDTLSDWYLEWSYENMQPGPSARSGRGHRRAARPRSFADNVRGLNKEEVAQFLSWKNTVRHNLIKRVQKKGWTPSVKFQIRKLKWLLTHETVEGMAAAWATLDPERRARIWPNMVSSAMLSCPEKALMVLKATLDPLPPGYAVQDTLHFLVMWQSLLPPEDLAAHADELADTVIDLLARYHKQDDTRLVMRQAVLYRIISTISPSKLQTLYTKLVEFDHRLHTNTILQIASHLAKDPSHIDDSLRIATAVADVGAADLTSPAWASLCTSLLSAKPQQHDDQDATASTIEAFETLLQSGLVPNLFNFTALIRSLCRAGRLDTAWEVVQIMNSHGIKPDAVLVSTLLDGGRRFLSVPDVEKSTKMAIDHQVIDVPFLNELLSSVFDFSVDGASRQGAHSPRVVPAFLPMLHFYSKIFHLEPLQHLIPVDLSVLTKIGPRVPERWDRPTQLFPILEQAAAAIPEKLHPTGTTLALMYIAYVRSLSKASSVLSLYSYIRQLILRSDKVYTTFVQEKGTLLHDVIIARLCEHPSMLRAALDVIGDMLKAKKKRNDLVADKPEPSHPIPSEYTWNILLHGFMANRETASGERILSMMKENGVQPILVTWNTLLSGYARAQNAGKVMTTLRALEENNLQADEYTMRAFARVARKESVLREIEMVMTNQQKAASESIRRGAADLSRKQNSPSFTHTP